MEENKAIGVISHYYSHIKVAVVKLTGAIKVGDKIKVKGHTTDFEQEITSMQKDHKSIDTAKKGEEIGLGVVDKVRDHDQVFKV